jgi:hypothetical protein
MRATVTLQVILQTDVIVSDVLAFVASLEGAVDNGAIIAGATTVVFEDGDMSALAGPDCSAVWLSPEDLIGFKARFVVTMDPCDRLAAAASTIVDAVCNSFGARPAVIDNRLALFLGPGPMDGDADADINDYHGLDVAAAILLHTKPDPTDTAERLFKCERCARWTPGWDIAYGHGDGNVFMKRLLHVASGGVSIMCGECEIEIAAIDNLSDNAFFNDKDGAVNDWCDVRSVQSGGPVVD